MGERQLSLGKKKYSINGGLNFFSWTPFEAVSWGLARVQLTCTCLQVCQERKEGAVVEGERACALLFPCLEFDI